MKTERLVLSIETSLREGSLSLLSGDSELGTWKGNEVVSRSEDLVSGIQELFDNNNNNIEELDLIAVSEGPGSFTGLRVGIAIGKGLAFALGCRLVGVPILHSMAFYARRESFDKRKIICVVGAGREHVYYQIFDSERDFFEPLSDIKLTKIIDLSEDVTLFKEARVVCEVNMHGDLINLRESGIELTVIRENISRYIGQYAQRMSDNSVLAGKDVTPIYVRDV